MRGSLWRSEELSWPICHRSLSAHWDPEWPPAVSACQTAANLVFGDGQEGRRGEGGGALGWRHTKRCGGGGMSCHCPSLQLISVSDKVVQRVHLGLHNKSIRE